MSQTTRHRYVATDDRILGGEPIVQGTRTPIRAIVELWRQGIAPESVPTHLPHLSLAQVFDALSYYSEHQEEINAFIEQNRVPDDAIDPRVRDDHCRPAFSPRHSAPVARNTPSGHRR